MKDTPTQILVSLCETDKTIHHLNVRKKDIETARNSKFQELTQKRQSLALVEAEHKDGASRQALEEHRLKDEERKIVERRKQLTAIGGMKSAKLVERELDIASRVMEGMEKSAFDVMESVQNLEQKLQQLRTELEGLESNFESEQSSVESDLSQITEELKSAQSDRDGIAGKLDPRLKTLYLRVQTRYPGDALARAEGGACRSCFRALPHQTFNQVIAGNNLIQCPGCSRILVHTES